MSACPKDGNIPATRVASFPLAAVGTPPGWYRTDPRMLLRHRAIKRDVRTGVRRLTAEWTLPATFSRDRASAGPIELAAVQNVGCG